MSQDYGSLSNSAPKVLEICDARKDDAICDCVRDEAHHGLYLDDEFLARIKV